MVSNILNTGLQGIRQGVQGAEKAASQIARAGQSGSGDDAAASQGNDLYTDLAEPLVDLKLYETSVKASAKVVKVADEVIGTLLDIKA
ncbi:flagellar biosynthesis protein FlgE [Hahella sp. CCB-MM4]|uniref:flagellar biosynthesis protein FlgE n=1 Tax=Hahella sp. (strain CCB-MM4) TaxID=1926491 RepID=UPI000B9A6C3C|nr:flagellar biosynthesis protein FlgE [Hahella sp. CCB-MM4]OZG71510.1 flagellar biosynthesis protein FlgE [Hahella sp. CCB-MM4]